MAGEANEEFIIGIFSVMIAVSMQARCSNDSTSTTCEQEESAAAIHNTRTRIQPLVRSTTGACRTSFDEATVRLVGCMAVKTRLLIRTKNVAKLNMTLTQNEIKTKKKIIKLIKYCKNKVETIINKVKIEFTQDK